MLSREIGKCNKGRNRILLGTVILCIVTLTMVFGISFGQVQAEYTKAVRAAGTAASGCIGDADQDVYKRQGILFEYTGKVLAGRKAEGVRNIGD